MDKSIVYVIEARKCQSDSECSVEKGEVILVHDATPEQLVLFAKGILNMYS
jgi:hypothetical protein